MIIIPVVFSLNANDIIAAVQRTFRESLKVDDLQDIVCQVKGNTTTNPTTPVPSPSQTPTPTPTQSTTCSKVWEQCGGINWSGPKCCQSGNRCSFSNPWYSQCLPDTSATPTPTPSQTPTPTPTPTQGGQSGSIPITSGNTATLTYFDDNVVQCFSQIPAGNGCAVNPLLLGFTENEWTTKYLRASPNAIPWCGKKLTFTVNSKTWSCTIIDSCDPVGNPFQSGNQIVGGKCDYTNVIDVYGQTGRNFLLETVGDDFFQGNVQWKIE